jgi:hypothetical protein
MSAAISVGATVLGALFGRKTFSATNLSRASSAARAATRTYKERQDIQRATETVGAVEQQLDDLNAQLESEIAAAQAKADPMSEQFETVEVRPKKTNISIRLVCLAWEPI